MGGGTDDGAEVLAPSTEVEVAEQIMQRLQIRIEEIRTSSGMRAGSTELLLMLRKIKTAQPSVD